MDDIGQLIGLALLVTLAVAVLVVGGIGLLAHFSSKPVEEKYVAGGGGLAGGYASGLEAVFSPTAHEAGAELERMTKRSAPAPVAGDPPWAIDGDRIRLDL
ncbi:hypothetical protein ACFWHT_08420 [Microbacterium sp. NPDC058342]|uniref:hypothetical protein n=1 Tax=Microbacterium sp. NPDC058342 TaxID=3346454 RepID=UPI0036555F55